MGRSSRTAHEWRNRVTDSDLHTLSTADLIAWRCRQLLQSGFPQALAAQVARDPHFDLHALIELSERECPPELAVRILAPLQSVADTR